jgi:cell division protein FtsB
MKKIILTASWFAVAVYCLLASVYGPAGLLITDQAKVSAAAMRENIELLEKLNADYALEWNALRNDAGLTAVQGRSLGFIASDEVVVRVALPSDASRPAFIGERVLFVPGRSLSSAGIRLASLYVWLFVILAGLVSRLSGGWKGREAPGSRRGWLQRAMRNQDASRT